MGVLAGLRERCLSLQCGIWKHAFLSAAVACLLPVLRLTKLRFFFFKVLKILKKKEEEEKRAWRH